MSKNLLQFIKHPTSLHVLINTLGNYLNIFFSLLFVLILAKIFTREDLGTFNVLFGIAYVLANILDFGVSATIYSYLPPLFQDREKNEQALLRFIKSTFYYQSLFASAVIVILFFIFPYLDKVFFKTGAPPMVLYLTAFSVLLFIWQNFVTNILFAAKKFLKANVYLNASNVLKTLILGVLVLTNNVTIGSVLFVFGIVGPIIFFIILFMQKKDLILVLLKSEVRKEDIRLGYTFKYFISSQFYNLGLRMDLFLLSFFEMKAEAGDYGIAQKIILSIIATIVSVTQVLSPGFTTIDNQKEARQQFKTSLLYLMLPAGIFVALFLTPEFVFKAVFPTLTQLSDIAHAMALPFVLASLGSAPMLFLLYTIKKPGYILFTNILFFIIITAFSYVLIPTRGVFGPPLGILVAFIVAVGIQSIASYVEYKKLPKQ